MLSHTNLQLYFEIMFGMVQHHKYSIKELEDLIPFERDIYFSMLIKHIKKQEEK